MTLLSCLLSATLGALAWTLSEYLIHRFDGHGARRLIPNHRHHHRDPQNYEILPTPWSSFFIVVGLWTLLGTVVAGLLQGLVFGAAFVGAYRYYEVLHQRLHERAPRNSYGRWARKHHFYHHFHNPKLNHGVTTSLWDIVFGTHHPVQEPIRVPRKMAMPWLFDDAGEIGTPHVQAYTLR
jgi:sterol desaturase/sphingolipid hydroxylase (fatty acid hydroxylase superfamily)